MQESPFKEELAQIPPLDAVRDTPVDERILYLHFTRAGVDWYVAGFDGKDTFYGFVDYHDPINEAEWQLFSFSKLKNKRSDNIEIELDPYWSPIKFSDRPIDLIEVDLPKLTLTCGKCGEPHTDLLQLVIAYVKIAPHKTPCCGKAGRFKEKEILSHIRALLHTEENKREAAVNDEVH